MADSVIKLSMWQKSRSAQKYLQNTCWTPKVLAKYLWEKEYQDRVPDLQVGEVARESRLGVGME